jgi:hypothetical protein
MAANTQPVTAPVLEPARPFVEMTDALKAVIARQEGAGWVFTTLTGHPHQAIDWKWI